MLICLHPLSFLRQWTHYCFLTCLSLVSVTSCSAVYICLNCKRSDSTDHSGKDNVVKGLNYTLSASVATTAKGDASAKSGAAGHQSVKGAASNHSDQGCTMYRWALQCDE